MSRMRMLVFGGCNVRGPIYRAWGYWRQGDGAGWDGVPSDLIVAGPHFFTFTIGEMLQTIACYQGDLVIPTALADLCHMGPKFAPTPAISPLADCDVALIEPNTSVEIEFEGVFLNRGPLLRMLAPLKALGPDARKLHTLWYNKGIVGPDSDARSEAAERLVPMVPNDLPGRELVVEILRGAVGRRRDVREGLCRLNQALAVPVGVVPFTWSYLPDGRAVSWPSGFHQEVVDAAHALGLPLFEPREIVMRTGIEVALQKDLTHYAESFMPVLAAPMVEFARSLMTRAPRDH